MNHITVSVASKAKHWSWWQSLRGAGVPIISTWIDWPHNIAGTPEPTADEWRVRWERNLSDACAADMVLQGLVACAGVTLRVVATAMGIAVRGGSVRAEGVLDFRGTMGVSKDAPVGFREISLHLDPDCDATPEQRARLLQLTERYCVDYQTLKSPPILSTTITGLGDEGIKRR